MPALTEQLRLARLSTLVRLGWVGKSELTMAVAEVAQVDFPGAMFHFDLGPLLQDADLTDEIDAIALAVRAEAAARRVLLVRGLLQSPPG